MHSVVLKADGSLWSWGWNIHGQLGDGTTTDGLVPRQIGTGYFSVATGWDHTVAVKGDGTLWTWGHNSSGQLGDGTTTDRLVPQQIGTGFAAIAAGTYHTMAIKTDGSLWAWGQNNTGQLGDGTITSRLTPKQIGTGYASVAVGEKHTVAVKTDGSLWAWGDNTFGQLGDGTSTDRHTPRQIGTGYSIVAAAGFTSFAIKSSPRTASSLWGWGKNDRGQVGDGTITDVFGPKEIGTGYSSVAAGPYHSAAIKSQLVLNDTLWTWGVNVYGQLGDGTTAQSLVPKNIGAGYSSVAAGYGHTIAIKADGSVWAWGANAVGQLGDGSTTDRLTPVQIMAPGSVISSSDCLFNWAEANYPTLFSPAAASSTYAPYYYRYYSETNAYLGKSSADEHVYYLGPAYPEGMLDLGPAVTWLATAGCN